MKIFQDWKNSVIYSLNPKFNNSKMTIWKIPLNKSESFKKIFNNNDRWI